MDKTETKTVYAFAADGKFTGTITLNYTDRSPVSGIWQLPAGTTETAPPEEKSGYDRIWKGTAWEYQAQVSEATTTKAIETVDPTLLSIMEALAAQEGRLTKLEGGATA